MGLLLRLYFTGSFVKVTVIATLARRSFLTFSPLDETLIMTICLTFLFSQLFYCPHQSIRSSLTESLLCVLQEVKDEAKREEAPSRGEEAVFGARVHEDPRGGLRSEGVGGVAQRDRPQRMARQQQCVSGGSMQSDLRVLNGVGCLVKPYPGGFFSSLLWLKVICILRCI